jgi:DNA-binding GntR family transcriptional regulator
LRPNRAALVATPSADESREIFQARRAIEEAALALVIERGSPREIEGMRALVASEQKAYDAGDTRRGLQLAIEFHRRLTRLGGNTILADFLEQLMARTPLVALTHRGTGAWTCSTEEHSLILDALDARDLGRAISLMRDHLRHLEREAIAERPSPPADIAHVFGRRAAA